MNSNTQDKKLSPTEEKRREEEVYLNKLNKTNENNFKIVRTISIHVFTWESARQFSDFMHYSLSFMVEKALTEYMMNHANELPLSSTFTVSVNEPKPEYCDIQGCIEKPVARALWIPKKKPRPLCMKHFLVAKAEPFRWKILEEP